MSSNITSDDDDEDMIPTIARVTILSLVLLSSFSGNLLVIITVLQTKQLRCGVLYLSVLNIAAFNILECIINITFVLGKSATGNWRYETTQCSVNSFFMTFTCIGSVLGLTVLTVHQILAVSIPEKYDKFRTGKRCLIILGYTWVHSFIFSAPLTGSVDSSSLPFLYMCSFSDTAVLIYTCSTAILCYFTPLVFMFLSFIYIIRKAAKEKFTVRAMVTQTSYLDKPSLTPSLSREIDSAKFSGCLFVSWLMLVFPHTFCNYIHQFQYNDEIESASVLGQLTYSWLVDQVFLWTRFLYGLILPILIYIFKKDIWLAFRDLVLCKKNNSIKDISGKPEFVQQISTDCKPKKCSDKSEKNKDIIPSSTFQIPVLFATDHALHIQTPDIRECQNKQISDSHCTDMSNSDKLNQLQGKKCDVLGSQLNFNCNEDTSDYDSEEEQDPLSISHPISSQAIRDPALKQKRSMSQSDIPKVTKSTSASSSRADSGLDLSNISKYSSIESNLSKKSTDGVMGNVQDSTFVGYSSDREIKPSCTPDSVVNNDVEKLSTSTCIECNSVTNISEKNLSHSNCNTVVGGIIDRGRHASLVAEHVPALDCVDKQNKSDQQTHKMVCGRPPRLDPVILPGSTEKLLSKRAKSLKRSKRDKMSDVPENSNTNIQTDMLNESNIPSMCSEINVEKSAKNNKSKKRNFLSMHAKLEKRRTSDSQTSLLGSTSPVERHSVSCNSESDSNMHPSAKDFYTNPNFLFDSGISPFSDMYEGVPANTDTKG